MRFLVKSADDQWHTADFTTDLYRNAEALFKDKLPPDSGWQLIDESFAVDWINRVSAESV